MQYCYVHQLTFIYILLGIMEKVLIDFCLKNNIFYAK